MPFISHCALLNDMHPRRGIGSEGHGLLRLHNQCPRNYKEPGHRVVSEKDRAVHPL